MRKSNLTFTFLLLPVDFLMLLAAGWTAYFLRFKTIVDLRPVFFEFSLVKYSSWLIALALAIILIFAIAGLYSLRARRTWLEDSIKIALACSAGVMLVIIAVFFKRELFSSRFIILAGWVLGIIFVILGRTIIRLTRRLFFKTGHGLTKVLLLGRGQIADELDRFFHQRSEWGYQVVGWVREPVVEDILEFLNQNRLGVAELDELVMAEPDLNKTAKLALLDFCNEHNLTFRYAADLFETQTSKIRVETWAGIPVMAIQHTPLEGWGRIFKRLFDIIFSALGLIILSPLFAVLALLIKIDSSGHAVVGLERVGEKGRKFKLYKFRSMVKNAAQLKKELLSQNERSGPLFKIKADPRVTRLGKFLRVSSLDEFPQLWNVLRGEMSLVGPRPHELGEVDGYQKAHKRLLTIKPGITGMAQISGRADLDFETEAQLDIFYIENWSPRLDLQILIKTLPVVLSCRGAK